MSSNFLTGELKVSPRRVPWLRVEKRRATRASELALRASRASGAISLANRAPFGGTLTSHSIHRVSRVAQVYADALFELAENAGAVADVEKDLSAFADAVRTLEPLRRLLALPGVKNDQRARALVAVLEKAGAHALVRNVAGAAARNGRADALLDIAQAFARRAADARGEVRALVTFAQAPTEAQEAEIRARLKEVLGKEPVMTIDIDPALLGGMVARVGSRLVDASLRSRLEGVRQAMKGAS